MARTSKHGEPESPSVAATNGAGIDAVLDGLENVVKELESGDLPLERALERFEEGVRLARKGGQILDAVEARVETLLAERDEVVPLEPEAEENP